MHVHHLPKRLARAVAAPRFAAGVVVTLALLTAACSDPASRINAPPLNSASALAVAKTSAITSARTSAPTLGRAASFAALGEAEVTCTSPNPALPAVTISGGDVGSLVSVTGFPNLCTTNGNIHIGDATAAGAVADFHTAYTALAGIPCPRDARHNLSGDLIGQVLSPGIYCIHAVGLLTGQLTLRGGPTDIWIFKAFSAATTITPIGGSVVMDGGNACNVYWQVGAASFDNTDFVGNVLSGTAITFTGDGSSLVGRALAKTAVTMTGANIVACTAGKVHKGHKGDKGDKHHKGDKGDKGDKDHGGDHGDGRGGHDGGDHKDGGGGHNS